MKNKGLFLIICVVICVSFSCGKEGKPVPQDQKNIFTWRNADASFITQDCLQITISMVGAVQNIRYFSLELAPQQSSSNLPSELETISYCEDCPFIAKEVALLKPEEILRKELSNETIYIFSYCPKNKASAYQWRLVIENIFSQFPYVITTVTTVSQ